MTGAVPPARVLAVSAAVPTLHQIDGRPVLTSIVRTPLSGTLQIGANGPLNSQTAVHTEHVLAFAAANYDHWSAYLGVARWPWSDWGETLTLDLLDERALRIGDRLRVGAELVLEVTSPRLPCFKLAWRINQPVSVLVPMARDGRVGVYLRVVPPGPVQAGDPVHHEPAAQPGITVAALSSLLSREDSDADIPALQQARLMPALGGQAQVMVRSRLDRLTDGARTRTSRWQGWRRLRIDAIHDAAPSIRSFRLSAEDAAPLAPFRAGQFLVVPPPTVPTPAVGRCPTTPTGRTNTG